MVPKEFRKSLCVIAGWVTLLEALVWELGSIFLVGVYGCIWEFFHVNPHPNVWSMLYITYLMGSCQGPNGAQTLGFAVSPPTNPARVFDIWMWVYIVVTATWIPACVLLTLAASKEVRGRQGALLYYPWVAITGILVIVDFAGTIFYFLDILHTTTADDYAHLTANTTWADLTSNSPSDGKTTWLPSLFITLLFCRFVILWILNICFLYGVFKGSKAVSQYTIKYLQNTLVPDENKKTWKDKFYQGPDPALFEQQKHFNTNNSERIAQRAGTDNQNQTAQLESKQQGERERQKPPVRYKTDDFGIPIEEIRGDSDKKEQFFNQNGDRSPRTPFQSSVFDYTGRPVRTDSLKEQRRENAPPIASGVQIPPELNKFEPFSYIAGDQPQLMRRPVSRSNSRAEQPHIPKPDYTVADRRAASLEYVHNRFRVPSPKRPQSYNFDVPGGSRSPSSPNSPPPVPKKPVVVPRSARAPEYGTPQTRYIPQQAVPSQQKPYYTRQTSTQSNNYNINKLY